MSISYSCNWMGPVNYDWVKKHGEHWAGGRIDIYGTDSPYPDEYALRIMHSEDWGRLSNWLDTLKTERQLSYDELIAEYEKTNPPIRWWKNAADSALTVIDPNQSINTGY